MSRRRRPPYWLGTLLVIWLTGSPCGSFGQSKAALESEQGSDNRSSAESDPFRSDDLSFLEPTPRLLYGASNLSQFLDRWRDLLTESNVVELGPLHILHFGGSHVQAGRIGWAFRARLAADRPGLRVSRGILPPHRLVGENGPPETGWACSSSWRGQRSAHRRHQGDWGLSGLEASSDSSATLQTWSTQPSTAGCFSSVKVLTRPDTQGQWTLGGIDLPFTPGQNGIHEVRLDQQDLPDTVALIPPAGRAYLQGVLLLHEQPGLIYHDLGGNGASTSAWLRHPHFVTQLQDMQANLAILAWGINDAHMTPDRFKPQRFKDRYGALIDSLRLACPQTDILLVTNNDSHYRHRHNPNAEAVRKAMLDLVEEKNVACWDLYGTLGGAHSIDRLYKTGHAASDRLHFNRDGYQLIGDLLYDALTQAAFTLHPNSP
jgi:lysophospholipase L1-like esterase